jgi:hypothetical protein
MLSAPIFLGPTENPDKRPPFTVAEIILLKACVAIINCKGDKGSPYLKPREQKKLVAVPFTKTKKLIEETQCTIQLCHFSLKPHLLMAYTTKNPN